MGLYNFKARFVPFVESGEKTHTIRAIRAYPDKPGNTLHLYTGLRTKRARLLMRVPCVKVEEIEIAGESGVIVDGNALREDERNALAKRDGFPGGWPEMYEYWKQTHALPFTGHVIHWKAKL